MAFYDREPDVLIAGASARAAAFSAVRAGLKVSCADLFADRDLAAVADVTAITDWPAGIERWAKRFPERTPFLYVGGLENEPGLLSRINAERPLCGIFGEPLDWARTPENLRRIVEDAGLLFPHLASSVDVDPRRRWLVKPRRSAAGRGIRLWRGPKDRLDADEYFQEFIEGTPGSAAFLAGRDEVEFLGMTEQLLPDGPPLEAAAPFSYVGSITTDHDTAEALVCLGRMLAAEGLRGLFGVDFIRAGQQYVPVEVNPRYTAGMEVLELRAGRSLVAEHLTAFGRPISHREHHPRRAGRHFGKRIVYAPRPLLVLDISPPTNDEIASGAYLIADIPFPDSVVPAGAPICTVFASGETITECRESLRTQERNILARCRPV